MRSILLLLALSLPAFAQSATARNPNYGANKMAGGATLPATCTESQLYFKTAATKGVYQCVAGAWRRLVDADSSGNVSISTTLLVGHNTTGTIAVAKSDSGKVFTTSAATADVTYSLAAIACSAANEGVHFKFVQTHLTHDLYVDPNDADQFRGAYTTGVNGNRLKGDRVSGSTLSIVCVKDDDGAYRWFTLGVGNWSEVL